MRGISVLEEFNKKKGFLVIISVKVNKVIEKKKCWIEM